MLSKSRFRCLALSVLRVGRPAIGDSTAAITLGTVREPKIRGVPVAGSRFRGKL